MGICRSVLFLCMTFYLYILQSEIKESYYTGMSNNPEGRCYFHNTDDRNNYTKRYRPWKIAYKHAFDKKERALAAERKVKSWKSKKMIRLLVKGEID